MSDAPHFCRCQKADTCIIFVHPSAKIQRTINELMAEMAKWDDETGARSLLLFRSEYDDGVFESLTRNEALNP